MPAAKKHPSTRARRNTAATAARLPAAVSRRTIPELPEAALPDPAQPWHPMVLQMWGDLWRSPMSAEYHESDIHQLYLLMGLYQTFYTLPPEKFITRKELAGEIRLQRQAFGLTPYDRRRLEWTIETAETAKERGRDRRTRAAVPAPADDPRQSLRLA